MPIIASWNNESVYQATINAMVVDKYRNPVEDVTVRFTLTGEGSINRTIAVTTYDGLVSVTFKSAEDQNSNSIVTIDVPSNSDVAPVQLLIRVKSGIVGPFILDISLLDSDSYLVSQDYLDVAAAQGEDSVYVQWENLSTYFLPDGTLRPEWQHLK